MCVDPGATVRGYNVRATIDAFQFLPQRVRDLLSRHRIREDDLTTGGQVLVQRWLDVLHEISRSIGTAKLREVGTRIATAAAIPSTVTTVEAVLLGLDDVYHFNHRGRVGSYRSSRHGERGIRVECHTPYPRAFERGIVEGFARHPRLAAGRRFDVLYEDGPAGTDHTCTLTVMGL